MVRKSAARRVYSDRTVIPREPAENTRQVLLKPVQRRDPLTVTVEAPGYVLRPPEEQQKHLLGPAPLAGPLFQLKHRRLLTDEIVVISLKRSMQDYDSVRTLAGDAVRALSSTLEAIKQYVVETDPASVAQFRAHLTRSLQELEPCIGSPDPGLINDMPTRVRGELREYRDRASSYIDKIREDLARTALALDDMVQNVQTDGSESEQQLTTEVARLRALAVLDNLAQIKSGVEKSVSSLGACIEQMRREKAAIIAQLNDEIRVLQRSVEQAQRAAAVDAVTGVYKREEFEKLLWREIIAERPTCVIHLWLSNLSELIEVHSSAIIDQLLIAMCKRVKNIIPPEAVLARWQNDSFCMLLPPSLVKRTLPELMQRCVGRYVCMDNGKAVTLHLQLTGTSISPESGESGGSFLERLQRLHGESLANS